jgi:prepilin-type N-terminal cleavage/methylation domain-containing protein
MFKTNNHKYLKAFSLIELSIVILIIGILVAGVTQSSRLINAMRIQSARSITLSSPVSSINGLVLWLETTLEKSFDPNQASNGSEISTWFDINPQTTTPLNATQPTTGRRPIYNSAGSLPLVNFNGATNGHFLSLPDNTIPSGDSAFSIFMVFRMPYDGAIKNHDILVAGLWSNPINLTRIYKQASSYTVINYLAGGATTASQVLTGNINSDSLIIFSAIYKSSSPKTLTGFLNSTQFASSGVPDPRATGSSYQMIGGNAWVNFEFFRGDIAEIIMFNRNISNDERVDVEKYLAKKWSIKI